MNLSTCTNTFSTIPLDTYTDLSASNKVTEVGFKSPSWDFEKLNMEVNSH